MCVKPLLSFSAVGVPCLESLQQDEQLPALPYVWKGRKLEEMRQWFPGEESSSSTSDDRCDTIKSECIKKGGLSGGLQRSLQRKGEQQLGLSSLKSAPCV